MSYAIPDFESKICPPALLTARAALLARPLVFTNGCFDIVHRGHVTYLGQAAALGGSMVVALNSDASVRRQGKGDGRPVNTLADRLAVIAALGCVSLVTWFDEDTPTELIRDIRPDILVKGGDYDMDRLPETSVVRAYGGRALALPFVDGYSTTRLVSRIRAGSAG